MNQTIDAHKPVTIPQGGRLSVKHKMMFGVGQMVEAGVTFVTSTFLLYYLTNVCGINPALAGTIIFVSLVVDAIADPLIGSSSDRLKSRWGRRLPFMISGLPIMALASYMLFQIPPGNGNTVAVAYALIANIALRLSTSIYAMPYSSLTAELTTDYNERSSITTYRALFNFVGTLACVVPAFQLIFNEPNKMSSAPAYGQLGLLLACVIVVSGSVCIAGIWKLVVPKTGRDLVFASQHNSVASDVRDLFRNRSFVLLFACCVITLVASGSLQALNLYAYKYYWKITPEQTQTAVLAIQVGLFFGIPLAALIYRRVEKRTGMAIALVMMAIGQGLPVLLLKAGMLANVPMLTILCAISGIYGLGASMTFIGIQSMVADAIDEHEYKFGTRCEGLYYSSLVFAAKAAIGAGSLFAGLILDIVGLKGIERAEAAPQLTEASAQLLGMLWGPGHAILILIGVPLLMAYRIDRKEHTLIIAALSARSNA